MWEEIVSKFRDIDARGTKIVLNTGFVAGGKLMIEGRVKDPPGASQVTVAIASATWCAPSDFEGYFSVDDAAPTLTPGWQTITAQVDGNSATAEVLVASPGNRLAIISDIDDTVLVSDVQDRLKLIANYTLLTPQDRRAVPGVADFYKRLAAQNDSPDLTPIFYLSASPRQLQSYLQQFLDHNAFPSGVLITRKLELEAGGDPVLDQIKYKTGRIQEILQRFADVQFVLVGDDGEHDPETYNGIQTSPNLLAQVQHVWIHKVSTNSQRATYPNQGDLNVALTAGP